MQKSKRSPTKKPVNPSLSPAKQAQSPIQVVRDDTLSDVEQFTHYVMRFGVRLGFPSSLEDVRRWLLELMLLGLLWFEESVPDDLTIHFPYQLNPHPLESLPEWAIIRRILKYWDEELEFLCTRLKRPAWASKRNDLRGMISLVEARKSWQPY